MYLETIIEQLNHPEAKKRLLAIYILDMVDEVRALGAISARVPIEMDTNIENRLKEVGRRLNKLKRDGYDTVQAICEHYNIYREVLARAEEEELKKIQHIVGFTDEQSQDSDIGNKILLTSNQVIAAQVLGIGAALGGTAVNISSNMGSVTKTLQKSAKRVLPTTPTSTKFNQWLKTLKFGEPEERQQMIVQLNSTCNPEALPYIAHVYMTDPKQVVRDTAKRLGRILYWNTIYYELTLDGTIDKIMIDFASSLGITLEERTITRPAPQESAENILAKAETQRKKRDK